MAEIADQDLTDFHQAWFHGDEQPADEYLYPGGPSLVLLTPEGALAFGGARQAEGRTALAPPRGLLR